MSWNENLVVLSSNVWGKDSGSSTTLPKDSVALCAYQLLVQGIADMDQIAYLHQTACSDELWMITEETPYDDPERVSVDETTELDTIFQGKPKQAMRVLTMNHARSAYNSGMFLLSEYFDAVCGFYSPVIFLAEGLVVRSDYEEIIQRQKATIKRNQEAASKRETEIIRVATQMGLHPQPPLLNPEIWSARCPGTGHQLYINARKNEFGCGYCCRKGGPQDLRDFAASRKGE